MSVIYQRTTSPSGNPAITTVVDNVVVEHRSFADVDARERAYKSLRAAVRRGVIRPEDFANQIFSGSFRPTEDEVIRRMR